jgi:hypothetical protein
MSNFIITLPSWIISLALAKLNQGYPELWFNFFGLIKKSYESRGSTHLFQILKKVELV